MVPKIKDMFKLTERRLVVDKKKSKRRQCLHGVGRGLELLKQNKTGGCLKKKDVIKKETNRRGRRAGH